MKGFLRISLFLLTFTVEIKIKAAEVFREPRNCDRKIQSECLLFSNKLGGKIKIPNAHIYLGSESVMYRDSLDTWHLLRGVVRIESFAHFDLSTIVGKFESEKSQYILQSLDKRTYLFVLAGKVLTVLNSPSTPPYLLTAGYSNWYGTIDSTGFNEEGLPNSLVWKRFANQIGFENWYLIFKDKQRVEENEVVSVENISTFYLEMIQEIEQIRKDKQTAEENRRKAVAEEAIKIRQLFRKKFEIQSLDD